MTTSKSGPRVQYLDLAKGFGILLVIVYHLYLYYHIAHPLADFFSSFRMPLFFFLSGCVFKEYNSWFDFTKRKINNLLIPFIFFYIVCSYIIPHIANFIGIRIYKIAFSNFFSILLTKVAYPSSPIWYLLSLFEVNLLFYIIVTISKKFVARNLICIICSILIGCIGVFLGVNHIILPYSFDSSLSSLPFFTIGYYLFKEKSIINNPQHDKYLPIFIILAFLFVLCFGRDVNNRKNLFENYAWITFFPCGLLGSYGVLMTARKIGTLPLITYFGRYSLMILATHEVVFSIFGFFITRLHISNSLMFCCNLIATISSYYILIPLMKRYLPHVTAQKKVF